MPTVGSTSKPTNAAEAWGLNSKNVFGQKVTMPSGGPWRITKIAAWVRGWNASCGVKLCLWRDSTDNLLDSVAGQSVSGAALSTSAPILVDGTVDVTVDGGTVLWVGFTRDPADAVQFTTRSSGSHREKDSGSYTPGAIGGTSSHFGDMGAYIADYESANQAPNAPTNLSPSGGETVHQGGSTVISFTRSDPDSGDYITAVQRKYYRDDGTTLIADTGKDPVSGKPTTFQVTTVSFPVTGEYYKWKARTWDKEDAVGPYSALQRFRPNTLPLAPTNLQVDTDTLTPHFTGSFNDPDPGTDPVGQQAAVEIEVQLAASPNTVKWDTGAIANTSEQWDVVYAGTALAFGTAYRWRARNTDGAGGVGAWSSWQTWTPVAPVGPDNMSPRTTTTKQQTLTPTLTVGHLAAQFRNERIQVYAANSLGSTLLWDKAKEGADYANTNSKARVYAGTALNWGTTYYWRALIELTDGTDTAWSDLKPFYINALPAAPSGMTPTGGFATTDTTPDLFSVYEDPDKGPYGDTPNRLEWEVYNNTSGALVTSGNVTNPGAQGHTVQPAALTNETTYKWRARYRDQAGQFGPWSAYQVFKVTSAPGVTGVSPIGGAAVTESTPTLDWTFSSSGGKAQQSYRLRVFDKGPTGANYAEESPVYDSGTVISSATQQDLPLGVLLDDHDYRWEVTVTDKDALSTTLA